MRRSRVLQLSRTKAWPLALALAGLVLAIPPGRPHPLHGSQASRPLGLDDIRGVTGLPWVGVSPDGRHVAFLATGDTGADLWIADLSGGVPDRLTESGSVRSVAGWSAASDAIAFVADVDGEREAWTVAPDGPSRPVCALPADARGLAWAGSALSFIGRPATSGTREPGPAPRVSDRVPVGEAVFLCGAAADSARRVTGATFHGLEAAWSLGGDRLVISIQEEPGFYGALESDLHEVDIETGETAPLVTRPGVERAPIFSPDGRWVAFVTGFGRAGLLPNLGVAFVDVADGTLRDAGRVHDRGGFFEGPVLHGWSGDELYYSVVDGARTPLFRLRPTAAGIDSVSAPSPDGATYAYSLSADADVVAFKRSSTDVPPEIFVRTAADAERRITSLNDSLEPLGVPAAEVVTWTAPDGKRIEGLLLRSEGGAGPAPMITILHGGPASAYTLGFPGLAFFNPYQDMLLAARGYAVFLPNPRGSGGYGFDFRAAATRDWGDGPAADVLAGIEHLIDTGVAEPDRLGLMGWSYGGYLTAWILTMTDRFRVASVGAGVTDLVSHFGQSAPQMLEYFGAAPWEASDLYRSQSPIHRADRIRTPTLFFHGDSDVSVSPSQSELLHAALTTRGVPSVLVVYPDEGHTLRAPALQDDSWERLLAWVERWLGSR